MCSQARVACTLVFLYLARDRAFWHVALASYIVSFALDLFDGMAARRFNQTSRFGAVLDMVTDRCSTAVMLAVLAHLYAGTHPRAFDAFVVSPLFGLLALGFLAAFDLNPARRAPRAARTNARARERKQALNFCT